jgi:predicted nicotinamide N-methyase
VADPDVVLDQIVEAEDRRERLTGQRRDGNDLHLPYWAELWDSAFAIGELIVERGAWGGGSEINDAPRHTPHAPRPTVLDLGCGQGFAGMVAAAMGADVLFADLEPDALLFARLNTLPWHAQVRTRQINWQIDRLEESFDVILGADVLYDRTQWDFLEPFFRAHVRRRGMILLGEPGRQTGDMFPEWIVTRRWEIETVEQRVPTRAKPVRVFRLELT